MKTGTRGARVSNVRFAALCMERGYTFITFVHDDARFPGLKWQEPAA